MKESLALIPQRIRELREILDIDRQTMAHKIAVTLGQYGDYEDGVQDIPISTLYDIAAVLGVDFTVLLTGEQPRMNSQCVVRKGEGVSVDRYEGYSFASLASNYIGRVMEPLLVTIEPSDTVTTPVVHHGQEFNYVLSGTVKVTVDQREHLLTAGDSIYFDPSLPHSQTAVGSRATFLTVINDIVEPRGRK